MSQYSALLRRQPEWWTKYQDENVRVEWRKLAGLPCVSIVKTPSSFTEVTLSAKQVNPLKSFDPLNPSLWQVEYIIDELGGYAALRDEANRW